MSSTSEAKPAKDCSICRSKVDVKESGHGAFKVVTREHYAELELCGGCADLIAKILKHGHVAITDRALAGF